MPNLTWAELAHHKVDHVCRDGIENWEYCRAMIGHMRRMEQLEQWTVAGFVGVAFILLSLAITMVKRGRTLRVPAPTAIRIVTAVPSVRQAGFLAPPTAGEPAAS